MIDDKNNNLIDKYLGLANKQKIYYDMDDVKKFEQSQYMYVTINLKLKL